MKGRSWPGSCTSTVGENFSYSVGTMPHQAGSKYSGLIERFLRGDIWLECFQYDGLRLPCLQSPISSSPEASDYSDTDLSKAASKSHSSL